MAWRPHELEGAPFELDHLHTSTTETFPAGERRRRGASMGGRLFARFFPRHSRETRRATVSSLGLIGAAPALLFAGRAVLSGASGAPNTVNDPLANAGRALLGAP